MLLVASMIAAAVLIFGVRLFAARDDGDVEALVAATNHVAYRGIEARISGSFDYKPLRRRTRGSAPDDLNLNVAAAKVIAAAQRDPSAEQLHAIGVAHLLTNRIRLSVVALEDALRKETGTEQLPAAIGRSTDVALLNDLSAAYVAEGSADVLLPAIAASDRATRIDSQSAVSAWNRAVALDALGAREDAREAWDAYLMLDPDSEWAAEARSRSAATNVTRDEDLWRTAAADLRRAAEGDEQEKLRVLVDRFPVRAAALVERELLPAWGRAVLSGETGTVQLKSASRIADAIASSTGDSLLRDVIRGARPEIAGVYASYGDLGAVFRSSGTVGVAARLRELRDRLVKHHSPAALRFTLALAKSRYEARDHTAALAELDHLEGFVDRYPISKGQYFWFRGLAEESLGYAQEAVQSYESSIAEYKRLGDEGAAGSVALMRADAAEYAGDLEQAWAFYRIAIRDLDLHGDAVMRDLAVYSIARSSLRLGYPDVALILQTRLIDRLRKSEQTPYLCQALIARCESNAVRGNAAAAREDCRVARTLFDGLTDAATRGRLEADLEVSTALAGAAGGTIDPLTSALNISLSGNDHFRITRLYLARARASSAKGDELAAERDLRAAIEEVDRQRLKLSSTDFRISWIDSWRTAHENLVSLLIRQGRIDEAFTEADATRALVLRDRVGSAAATMSSVRQKLAPDAAFVSLWTMSDERTIAWIVRPGGIVCRQFKIRGATRRIRALVKSFEPRGEAPPADATAEALFDDVIRPWTNDLTGVRTVLIAPDGILGQLPFAALRDNRSGRTFNADHEIAIEPSASIFAAQKGSAGRRWESVLVVENPKAVESSFETLSTHGELRALRSGIFRDVQVLSQSRATPSRFLAAAEGRDVIHFAGHAVDDLQKDGALVFAADEKYPDGMLSGRDIAAAGRGNGGLVVLAACKTSRGRISSEGTIGLTRSFLVWGATSVIGSLWDVDDEATDRLFAAFYRHLADGQRVSSALRSAQVDIAANDPDPRYWAGFQVYGGE